MKEYLYQIQDTEDGTLYTCVHEPDGWGEYGVTYGRETGISNVVKGYVSEWTFVKEDARWLKSRLLANGPNRRLRMIVYDLKQNLSSTREVIYEGDIDMTQAEWDGSTFKAPTDEGGFFKALENKWSEEYETPFDSYVKIEGATFRGGSAMNGLSSLEHTVPLPDMTRLMYSHKLNIRNDSEINDEFLQDTDTSYIYPSYPGAMLPNYVCGDPRTKLSKSMCFFMSGIRDIKRLTISYNIKASLSVDNLSITGNTNWYCRHRLSLYAIPMARFNQQLDTYLRYQVDDMNQNIPSQNHQYFHCLKVCYENVSAKKISKNTGATYTASFSSTGSDGIDHPFEITDFDTLNSTGMCFMLVVDFDLGKQYNYGGASQSANPSSTIKYQSLNNDCEVGYDLRINANKYVAAIPTSDLFRSIIDKINGGRYSIQYQTSAFDAVANGDLVTAGQGMKNIPNPQYRSFFMHGNVKTTLESFLQYAYAVYGYRLGVTRTPSGYTVELAHDPVFYSGTKIGEVNKLKDISFTLWREALYSVIRVGHEADSDIFNGSEEYNCVMTWKTPNTEIEGNELDLVSTYNAASRYFETFLYKNYTKYDDSSGDDSRVFLLHCKRIGIYAQGKPIQGPLYELDRTIAVTAGVDFPDEQWNVKYTPKRMLTAHTVELNSLMAMDAGKAVTLETCDNNRDLVAGGVVEAADITIGTSRVFVPIKASFSAIAAKRWIKDIEANRTGYVEFRHNGKTIRGYIADGEDSITVNPIRQSESGFTLLLTSIDI